MLTKKFFLLIFFISLSIFAQEDKLIENKWLPAGVAGINLSQIALENWTQGGENALSFALFGNLGLDYHSLPWSFRNTLKLAFGQTKLGDQSFRTADNEIFMENLLSYNVGWVANPYFSNTFRSVIANGYKYDGDLKTQIAAFLDPGYLMQSIGLEYIPYQNFTTRIGVGFQETFTNNYRFYTDPENLVDKFKFETGLESVTKGSVKLDDNLNYAAELRLFSAFDKLDVWDVRFDNILTAQISKYVNVNLNVLLIHDIDQTRKTQLKEALQIGLTYNLF